MVREGSRRFDTLELPRTSAKGPCTPCFSSKYVDRGGSIQSNHPETILKNSTHFAISAMMWFEKVRGGLMRFNYPELVQKHPAHLASPLNMYIDGGGLVQSNHPEPMLKNSTHFTCNDVVKESSLESNHPELM